MGYPGAHDKGVLTERFEGKALEGLEDEYREVRRVQTV